MGVYSISLLCPWNRADGRGVQRRKRPSPDRTGTSLTAWRDETRKYLDSWTGTWKVWKLILRTPSLRRNSSGLSPSCAVWDQVRSCSAALLGGELVKPPPSSAGSPPLERMSLSSEHKILNLAC